MYCRDTGDVATSHLTKLRRLKKYFASHTRATDRTPQYLSEIDSLESIDLSSIPGITNAGIAALTRLPRLRELRLGGMQHVDLRGAAGVSRGGEARRAELTPVTVCFFKAPGSGTPAAT